MSLVSVLSQSQAGGTFVSWTLHYLAGHSDYFYVAEDKLKSIPDNPLTERNAHNFKPNWANSIPGCTIDHYKHIVNRLLSTPTNSFHVNYTHQFSNTDLNTSTTEFLDTVDSKNIVINSAKYPLYFCNYHYRSNVLTDTNEIITDSKDIFNYYTNKYFKDSKDNWDKLNLNSHWDTREFIALNFRPFNGVWELQNPRDYYTLDALDLWLNFDRTVAQLFDYLNININPTRLVMWENIYKEWQKFHQNRVLFVLYFNEIIDCILNNRHLDLEKFKLDLGQEATIQHVLLYKHNLNLKTWQLEKFTDTRQLHSLLEPNTHHKLNYTV